MKTVTKIFIFFLKLMIKLKKNSVAKGLKTCDNTAVKFGFFNRF